MAVKEPTIDIEGASTADLSEMIGACERELVALEAELAGTPGAIQEASREGNADEIFRLRRRSDELPVYISSQKVRVARLRVAEAEQVIPSLEADVPEAQTLNHFAHEAYVKAKLERDAAYNRLAGLEARLSDARLTLRQRQRQFEDATAQAERAATPAGPLVRSVWQAGS
jgi:chromosome segregation ATPase